MIKVLNGNMFESRCRTIVNAVNCVGVMGKGIAPELKRRYPEMYSEYRRLCREGLLKPGRPYLYSDIMGTSIINFPRKDDWREPSRLEYKADGLKWFNPISVVLEKLINCFAGSTFMPFSNQSTKSFFHQG